MKVRLLAWLVLVVGMLFCRAAFLEDVLYNVDEAEYAVESDALDHGWLPGVDLLGTTKPPGIVLFFNLLFHLFGRSLAVVHVAHVVLMIGAGMLIVELAIAWWGVSAAIPAAILFWMVSNSFSLPHEIIALNVESPAVVLMLFALWLAWSKPESPALLLVSGAALGAATIFRQSLVAFALPIFVSALGEGERRLRRGLIVLAGVVLPWIPLLAVYAHRSALGWAWDSWVRYPMAYAGDTGVAGFFDAFYYNGMDFALQAAVPLVLSILGVVWLWAERARRTTVVLAALLAASLLALASGSRFFGHYWIQIFPVIALLGTAAWLHMAAGPVGMKRLLIAGLILGAVVAALHFPTWRMWDRYAPPRGQSFFRLGKTQRERLVGEFARTHTKTDETIVVWGYCPQIYYHAQRLPGVRDFLCHYVTGYSPGTFDPLTQRAVRSSGHPQAQDMFVEDLDRWAPKYIFDLVPIQEYTFTFYNYSLRGYPLLADYVRRNYLPEGELDGVRVYRRRSPEDRWWPVEEPNH